MTMPTPSNQQPLLLDLPSLLHAAFPHAPDIVESHEIVRTIRQANAMGYIVHFPTATRPSSSSNSVSSSTPDNNNKSTNNNNPPSPPPPNVFVKQVLASTYVKTKKDWADLRRTLCYARTEVRFYRDFVPILPPNSARQLPHCYLATYHLEDWIPEEEPALATATTNHKLNDLPELSQLTPGPHVGGALVLECISSDLYRQDSPLSLQDCQACLQALASMHVAAWQKVDLLQRAETSLSKASFHLAVRNPKEWHGLPEAWQHFSKAFSSHLQQAGLVELDDLGRRLQRCAHYVSNQLTPHPTDPFCTLIHGDAKAMNVFLPQPQSTPTTSTADAAVLVDFASIGIGYGASDVAMHIHHAVEPHVLYDDQSTMSGEERLIRYYWETVQDLLQQQESPITTEYTWSLFYRHYRLAVVDYFRFFLGRMWKQATPETMARNSDNPNINLVNRSPQAAMAWIRRVQVYLTELEREEEGLTSGGTGE